MEYKGLSLDSVIFDEISTKIQQSYPNSCVLYIDEVVNKSLEDNYKKKQEELEKLRGSEIIKEIRLFHGTKYLCIGNIAQNGFRMKFNKVSAYGIGTYFSTSATYSKEYMDTDENGVSYMFVCDVLIGKVGQVPRDTQIDTKNIDTSVNNIKNPTIYVSPYDDGCYPRYLVAFHKQAR